MHSCQRMMSDFEVIYDGQALRTGVSGSILPETLLKVHRDSIAWLDEQFTRQPQMGGKPHNGPTVVITHHAPNYRSQHPRFVGRPISGGFCSNQERRIQCWQPELWIHMVMYMIRWITASAKRGCSAIPGDILIKGMNAYTVSRRLRLMPDIMYQKNCHYY